MCFLHKETKDERQRSLLIHRFIGGVWIIDCVEGSGRLQSDLILIFTKNRFVLSGVIATCGPLMWTKQEEVGTELTGLRLRKKTPLFDLL